MTRYTPMTEEDFAARDADEVLHETFETVPLNLNTIKYLVWRTGTKEVDLLEKYIDGLGTGDLYIITLFKLPKLN